MSRSHIRCTPWHADIRMGYVMRDDTVGICTVGSNVVLMMPPSVPCSVYPVITHLAWEVNSPLGPAHSCTRDFGAPQLMLSIM